MGYVENIREIVEGVSTMQIFSFLLITICLNVHFFPCSQILKKSSLTVLSIYYCVSSYVSIFPIECLNVPIPSLIIISYYSLGVCFVLLQTRLFCVITTQDLK